MIIDFLNNREIYSGLGERFNRAFAALAEGVGDRPAGEYDLGGCDARASVQQYQTRAPATCAWEVHRKFVDVHYVVSGVERVGWSQAARLHSRAPYCPQKDAELFDGDVGEYFELSAGMFAILFPGEVHRPRVQLHVPAPVIKVVVKVLMQPPTPVQHG